jgi:hypothetical protein
MSALVDPSGQLNALDWRARDALRAMAGRFRRQTGLALKVRSARRTCGQQGALYAQGRSAPGDVVTKARGCLSWHVWGLAADLDPVDPSGRKTGREADYAAAGAIWTALGGKWGGSFRGFPDIGHFEWHPGIKIAEVCPVPADCEGTIARARIATRSPTWRYAVLGAAGGVAALAAVWWWTERR